MTGSPSRPRQLAILLGVSLAGGAGAPALESDATAFVGARIVPIDGSEIEDGVLLIRGGQIESVGPRERVEVPRDARIVRLDGAVVMPGLVDTHSHIGRPAGADGSAPIQPEVRVLDSIDVLDPSFARARAGGVTTVNVMPGSGHLLSGQTAYLKLRRGAVIEELAVRGADGRLLGGMKMANGTNSRRDPPFPGTRGKSAALVRQAFHDALAYRDRLDDAGDDDPVALDLGKEALLEVLDGERIVHHHTHRHDDVATVLRLADEFGFRVVLHHVSDAALVAEMLAERRVPSSIILVDSPGGKLEARRISLDNGAALERAGAPVSLHTDDYITDSRLFLRMAALAVRAGMSREGALRAVTLSGAEMLGLDQRVGSLARGKDADFVVLSGDPLSVYTKILETWVEGERVFDRKTDEGRLAAVGGFGAGAPVDPDAAHLGCLGRDGGAR